MNEPYYWHGTGRYQYRQGKDSKYEQTSSSEVFDVLQSIIAADGLDIYFDPWRRDTQHIKTISLTPLKKYARLYAGIHRHENSNSRGESNLMRQGFYSILGTFLIELLHHPIQTTKEIIRFIPKDFSFKKGHAWASAVRRPRNGKVLKWLSSYTLCSDIDSNYPILFGIRKEGITPCSKNPIIDKIEIRVAHKIPLDMITHVEVPSQHIQETTTLLGLRGLSLPVVPLI